jgi:hypothetical protein
MGTIQVPDLKWEWRIGPQTLLSLLQLIAIVVAVIGGFLKMQADLDSSSKTISELKSLVATMQTAQVNQAERVTRVETKVDLIFPALQRIESRQLRTKEE